MLRRLIILVGLCAISSTYPGAQTTVYSQLKGLSRLPQPSLPVSRATVVTTLATSFSEQLDLIANETRDTRT